MTATTHPGRPPREGGPTTHTGRPPREGGPTTHSGRPPREGGPTTHSGRPPHECGQATIEFVALLLLCCLAFGALWVLRGGFDGRSFGGFLARHFVCAVGGHCDHDERRLVAAYGEHDAATVRALAPNLVYERGERQLPVDWRRCRRPECADAPDHPELDTHVSERRSRATAFTRLIRRAGRLYVQYWLYYPDSNSVLAGADRLWERSWLLPRLRELLHGTPDYPGFHRDDWEGVFVRVDPDGSTWMRASSHGHLQGCKWRTCHDRWVRNTGWVRVSRGSHSGHVPFRSEPVWRSPKSPVPPRYIPLPARPRRIPLLPGRDFDERSTTGEGLRLVPLETLDHRRYRALDPEVRPPWRKGVYADPESEES
jgi:hypothetical protein